jgi:hypothetical protein
MKGDPTQPEPFALLLPPEPIKRLERGLFALLLVSFAYFGSTPSWNPSSRFDLVRAMVEERDLSIDSFHENTGDKSLHAGHFYSDKAPGLSLLAAPVHAVRYLARWLADRVPEIEDPGWSRGSLFLCTLLTVGLLSAAASVALLRVCLALGAGPARALWIAIAWSIGTPAFAYSSLFFAHQAVASLLVIAFAILVGNRGREFSARALALVGGLLGASVVSEYPAVLGAAAIVAYALVSSPSPRTPRSATRALLLVAAGAVLPLALGAAYNWACFGAPWRIGYSTLVPSRFSIGMSRGIFGVGVPRLGALWEITFGGFRGLFPLSPILLLALAGAVWGAIRSSWKIEARLALAIFAAFLLLNSGYAFWDGGASLGPRHMVPALPFLALGLLGLPKGRAWAWLAGALTAISAANVLGGTATGADLPEWGNALTLHIWPAILGNRIPSEPLASNLGLAIGLKGSFSLLLLLIFWVVAAVPMVELVRRAEHGD